MNRAERRVARVFVWFAFALSLGGCKLLDFLGGMPTDSPYGTAVKLVITVQPTNTVVGTPISPAVLVNAVDRKGTPSPGSTCDVAVTLGANAAGATLSGTTTMSVWASGEARYTDLTIDKAGTGYTLVAAAVNCQLTAVTSVPFDVVGATP